MQVWMLGRDGTGSQHQLPPAAATSRPNGVPNPRADPPLHLRPVPVCPPVSNINPSARLSRINDQTYAVIPAL